VTKSTDVVMPTPTATRERLLAAIANGDGAECLAWLECSSGRDAVYELSRLSDGERARLLSILNPDDAADVVVKLPDAQAVSALEDLDVGVAADIVEELPSDERADLLLALDEADADAIICELEAEVATDVRRLTAYDEDSAGGLMSTEFLAFEQHETIRGLLADLEEHAERYANYSIQYVYVVDDGGRLVGVVPLRRLLLSSRGAVLRDVMIPDPVTVSDDAGFDDVVSLFEQHSFLGIPVVDGDGLFIGVVERRSAEHAAAEESDAIYRQSQGIVGGEELRSMPLLLRSRRRLAWLSVNIVLNIVAASVIALHQDTLEAVIALAVFLPIISDMSGCSGNQAVAVSMRELTLGVTRPRDIVRVLVKECSVGLLNGLALGLLIGVVAYAWRGDAVLGGVVGCALMANTVIAVAIGGSVPLLLKRLKVDPALAAGPILTTITDMCGFLLVLSLASAVLDKLT
jgi:magnesium transporter